MRRGAKPAKSDAKPPIVRKWRKSEGARVHDLEKRLAEALKREAEALEQQTATSEILRTIAHAQTDVQPVFDTIVRSAARLCHAVMASVILTDGRTLYLPANYGSSPEALTAVRARFPRPLDTESVSGAAILTRSVVHVSDVLEPSVVEFTRQAGQMLGYRSLVTVPMLREGRVVGAINVCRREPGRFSDAEVELLQTFADQAVIAIENTRLFTELQQKNGALIEALDRQTATSEILRVISQSPTDVQPVFDAIVESAVTLCDGLFGGLVRFDGEVIYPVATHNYTPEALDALRRVFPARPSRTLGVGRAILEREVVHLPDVRLDPEYQVRNLADAIGFRSGLFVPMLRDGAPIGAILVARAEPGPFSDSQIALLRTFADQAVIAIENVRLFRELEEKNRALTDAHATVSESLERQTATSEILRVISSSPTEVQPVFDAIASSATRLCDGLYGLVFRFDGEMITLVAEYGSSPERLEVIRSAYPAPPGRGSVAAQAILERRVIAIADAQSGTEYPHIAGRAKAIGYRSILSVPMLCGDVAIGAINVVRLEPIGFTDTQVELLKTFADQAVIAIENVRLFTELQEKNREVEQKSRELEAASRHKSEFLANMSHELRTPLNAIIGFSEVLGERMFGELNEKQDEYLKDIYASGQHLLSLINDILDLSKIEAGRMELELTDFDLPTAIDNALTLVRERASRRGIALHQAADAGLGQIRGDERKIKQVLLNLLSNAIKFTPDGGRIEARAKPVDGSVEVSVSDTGVGIAPEHQEAIFEEFRQVGTAAKKVEGTGLGLALSRKFIELHGGRIWVTSQVGMGSTFTFTIPMRCGA